MEDIELLFKIAKRLTIPGPDECWEWQGTKAQGYGVVSWRGGQESVPRKMLRLSGYDMDGYMACHHCDNRACCNPKHLYRGTILDNSRDAVERGRYLNSVHVGAGKSFPGELNPKAKLTASDVYRIRALKGVASAPKVAPQFGVSQWAIREIWLRKAWSHLPEI